MFDIKITTTRKKPSGEGKAPMVLLLFLIAGVLGLLLFVKSLEGIDYQEWLVLPAAILVCWAIWYSFFRHKKLFFLLFFLAVIGCGLVVWRQPDVLWEQTVHVMNVFIQEAELESIQVTQLGLLLAVLLPFFLFILEFLLKSNGILYLLITTLLFLPTFFGIQMKVEIVFLLVVFQLAFWTIHLTAGRSKKKRASGFSRLRLAGKSGVVISLLFVVIFSIVLSFVMIFPEQLFDSVYETEGYVYRSIQNLSDDASNPITGGQINQGNNYHTGVEQLKIYTDELPTEPLYLRGFSGGDYIGGEWLPADEDPIFAEMAKSDQMLWAGMVGNLYSNMYYVLNEETIFDTTPEDAFPENPVKYVIIQHSSGEYENTYMPYYNDDVGKIYYMEEIKNEYSYVYYEQKDMSIDWDVVKEDYTERGMEFYYWKIQRGYMEQAQETYTRIPVGRLPKLTALVEENPLTDLNDITAFILYTLHSNASYSLTPGRAPLNQDIVEYFLFDRGEGFCEHFAAAATLMYRLYGIPARYATGYRIAPSDFVDKEGDNDFLSTYEASVTDASAHAWVEIFLRNYGWTPIEVTPSSDGSTGVSYPGFNSSKLSQIWEENGWDISRPSLEKDVVYDSSAVRQGSNPDFLLNIRIDGEKLKDFLLALFICFGCAVLLLPFFLTYRRRKLQREMEDWDCRAVFYRMMESLHFGGLLSEYSGSELDFAKRLSEAVPDVSKDDAEELAAIVSKAAFGSTPPDVKENEFTRSVYHCVAASVYVGLTWPKKLVFRFVKAFE